MPKFNAKDFEKTLKKEINAQLNQMTQTKVAIVLDVLAKLAEPLTDSGKLTGKGKRASKSNNARGGAIGSPVWTGQYDLNHQIMINGVRPSPIILSGGESKYVGNPVNLTPSELVEREKQRIPRRLKFTDVISIVNTDPKADDIETYGTPLIPEGDFYGKAFQYLEARLQRDLGSSTTAILSDNGVAIDGENFDS